MIQLRVRTEFSFKQAFGPIKLVAQSLKGDATHAAIVDGDTWGHVKWAAVCKDAGIIPLFGCELVVEQPDGRRPTCWVLAMKDRTKEFYRLVSAAKQNEADTLELLRNANGKVIRFAGGALTDPATFDYVDINPGSVLAQRAAIALSKATKKPLVITSDNYYPLPEHRNAFLAMGGRERNTPQHIIQSMDEWYAAIPTLTKSDIKKALARNEEIAQRCTTTLPTAPLIKVEGDIRKVAEAGRKSRLKRKHLSKWPKLYEDRLQRELEAIEQKEYQSYFLVVADLVAWAKKHMLVGPARGSSAGSLLCYLTGITEVDPIPHGLLFERFIDLTRKDLPDIDIDFNDNKREMLFPYLAEKYGAANVARIGNINTFKPRSLMASVFNRLGIPDHERFDLINVLIEYSSGDSRYGKGIEDTLANTEIGRKFREKYPEAEVITMIENHASHTGVHAAGIIVSMEPVSDYCTVVDGIAHLDKPDAEALNLLKIDALGLRTLGVIEDAGVTTAEELYSLKLDDPKVIQVFNDKKFSSVFQFEGSSQRMVTAQVEVDSFKTLDHITALARPGPLGGGASGKYIARKAGQEQVTTAHPMLDEMLKDTYGVVLYQEQVMRIVREIGKFSWEDTTVIRKAMSGRKGTEFFDQKGELFIKGAAESGIAPDTARDIWNEICTFGAWGMNMSHTCSYAVISYWCAWMKAYHPLEYAAACLRGAKDDEGRLAVLREMAAEGTPYVAFDMKLSQLDWSVQGKKLVGGFLNFHGVGPAKAAGLIAMRDAGQYEELTKKLATHTLKFNDLYPLKTAYADLYAKHDALTSGEFPEEGKVVYIGRIIEKRPLDANETVRVARRNGKRYSGNTLFIDFRTRDDFGEVIMCRVDRFNWKNFGEPANNALEVGDDIIVRGRRVKGFAMLNVIRIKCLNKPGLEWAVKPRW
jgi:DNA-directed DNA polymerase III PolC